ncbi:MAG: hypothetical protein ACRD3C_04450 [Vicinamibacterales bacterium]
MAGLSGQTGTTGTSGSRHAFVSVQPPASVAAKARTPTPTASTQEGTAVGSRRAGVHTGHSAQDSDSLWSESIDIDGDGNVESADLLWDDEDRVLFVYDEGSFTCQNGESGAGEMLLAVYGRRNMKKKPAGSGWYVVDLDANECGVRTAGLYGCRFDPDARPTECGAAVVDDRRADVVIRPD